MLPFGARHRTPRLAGCSFSSFLPGAGVSHSGISFPALWMLVFEKQARSSLLEDGSHLNSRLQDPRLGGEGT